MRSTFPLFTELLRRFWWWYAGWTLVIIWFTTLPRTPGLGFAMTFALFAWCYGTVWPEFVVGVIAVKVMQPVLLSAGVTRRVFDRDTALWALLTTAIFGFAWAVLIGQGLSLPWQYAAVGACGKLTGVFVGQLSALTFQRWPHSIAVPLLLLSMPLMPAFLREAVGTSTSWGISIAVFVVASLAQVAAWWWLSQRTNPPQLTQPIAT